MKTPKGTELPFLIMERKSLDKTTNTWVVKKNPYLQVAHRLVWFREEHPAWGIETEFLTMEDTGKRAICVARIKDENGRLIATATKQETPTDFPDYIEKAETGAIGRALALCGYGTQYAPELDEGERLADSPITPAKFAPKPASSKPAPNKAVEDFNRTMPEPVKPAGPASVVSREPISRAGKAVKAGLEASV
uniref:Uncharacterized protein n=1 Tax=Eiseniibacteriota bacterium TaxID=2212470 RepID=A0A832I375_UNCEI